MYTNKLDSLDEMDKFLEKYKLPKLTKEEIENLNRAITRPITRITNSKTSTKKQKSPGSHNFTSEFYQTFKDSLIPTFHKLLQKLEQEENISNSFNENNINADIKTKKRTTRKLQRCKNAHQDISKPNVATHKKELYTMTK